MSGGQPAPADVAPVLAPAEPVDPAVDLAGFQHLLSREIRDDWRPNEWDSEVWVFTGVPGHLGTLVNRCRFPGRAPRSHAAAGCATSAPAATSGTPNAWAP